jgi:hypothetical protein
LSWANRANRANQLGLNASNASGGFLTLANQQLGAFRLVQTGGTRTDSLQLWGLYDLTLGVVDATGGFWTGVTGWVEGRRRGSMQLGAF